MVLQQISKILNHSVTTKGSVKTGEWKSLNRFKENEFLLLLLFLLIFLLLFLLGPFHLELFMSSPAFFV